MALDPKGDWKARRHVDTAETVGMMIFQDWLEKSEEESMRLCC